MPLRSLKSKLLAGVSVLVICSGVLISLLVTQTYSRSLFDAISTQAQYLANSVSLQAVDMVLTNDLVALQKTLDQQLLSNSSLSYLFIVNDGQVLAHTFAGGIPVDLISANHAASGVPTPHLVEISSKKGEYYLDIAVPIFDGKAGILRLGFSEKFYREQINKLWVKMGFFTFGILVLALAGSIFFVKRITGPVTELAKAADMVDRGDLNVKVRVAGHDEVAALGSSFNNMVQSLQAYTRRLQEQTMELARSHQQTRTFCGIVREIGSLNSLNEIGICLINRFRQIVECSQVALLLLNDTRDGIHIVTDSQAIDIREPESIQSIRTALEGLEGQDQPRSPGKSSLVIPVVSEAFPFATLHTMIPLIHETRLFGALLIACSGECRCNDEEISLVSLMLNQAAGVIRRAMLHEEEVRGLQSRIHAPVDFCGIISKNPKMQSIFKLIEDIAPTDASILIQGESGTGKELVAKAIHQKSARKDRPFIVIDCSAYPATLLESELFGHEKGAFTGAIRQKSGRFEQADGGTVFLDEIGEIPLTAQIKLLRVLQTQKFERLGGEQTLSVDVRIIAATNRNLLEEVQRGQFREDLYYRLNVIPINLPPLKDRRNDIPVLSRHFLHLFTEGKVKKVEGFSQDALRLLLDYPWPGNVRELENSIEHAAVLAKGERIEPAHLPSSLQAALHSSPRVNQSPTMLDHEIKILQDTMEQSGWNKKEAAKRLGISRSTLYEKLKRHRIIKPTAH